MLRGELDSESEEEASIDDDNTTIDEDASEEVRVEYDANLLEFRKRLFGHRKFVPDPNSNCVV